MPVVVFEGGRVWCAAALSHEFPRARGSAAYSSIDRRAGSVRLDSSARETPTAMQTRRRSARCQGHRAAAWANQYFAKAKSEWT